LITIIITIIILDLLKNIQVLLIFFYLLFIIYYLLFIIYYLLFIIYYYLGLIFLGRKNIYPLTAGNKSLKLMTNS